MLQKGEISAFERHRTNKLREKSKDVYNLCLEFVEEKDLERRRKEMVTTNLKMLKLSKEMTKDYCNY